MSIPDRVQRQYGGPEQVPSMPFVPHFLVRDMVGWYLALGILAVLAALYPWELSTKAEPFGETPPGTKPEWYFLFMFQTLRKVPEEVWGIKNAVLVVLFFAFVGLAVFLVPFLDSGAPRGRVRRVLNVLAAAAVLFFIAMTAWGLLE
jgi:cytochrome b6